VVESLKLIDGNMRIIWSASRYRGFYGSSIGKVNIVSSNLARQATGRVIAATLTIVLDSLCNFCDLELSLAESQRLASPLLPREPVRVKGRVDTHLDQVSEISWFLDATAGYLSLKVSSSPPEHWLELAEGTLYLGIAHGDRLGAIVFRGVENDPEGTLERTWLEQIEQGH
jgi:hypothetical protein